MGDSLLVFYLCCGWTRQQVGVGCVEVDERKKEVRRLEELSDASFLRLHSSQLLSS